MGTSIIVCVGVHASLHAYLPNDQACGNGQVGTNCAYLELVSYIAELKYRDYFL